MPWENEDTDDQNMEALRQEMSLENIMNSDIGTTAPTTADIKPGQWRLRLISNDVRLYTRCADDIYFLSMTKVT